MGIKRLKEVFKIEHIVRREGNSIHIGSAYCPALIKIDVEFQITKSSIVSSGELMGLYFALRQASKEGMLKRIIEETEVYKNPKPVYTNRNGKIKKEFCEKYGWPNLTTKGQLMYDNTFFKSRKDALLDARKGWRYSLGIDIKQIVSRLKDVQKSVKFLFVDLGEYVRLFVFFGYW